VLNTEDAVRAFSMGGNVTIGGNISAAAGPIGTGECFLLGIVYKSRRRKIALAQGEVSKPVWHTPHPCSLIPSRKVRSLSPHYFLNSTDSM
jgi:hypothetical protein